MSAATAAQRSERGEASPHDPLPRLRPYQATIARAILRLMLDGEGGSLSVEIARQGGKNETSAQVELITLLGHAAAGGTIVKCAPTFEPQARISLDRLAARAGGAGLARAFERRGHALHCGHARALFLSAEPAANVVGHTADLLLEVDEAQAVDSDKFDRDFRPMAASTNAPVVYYGTPWGAGSLLEQAKATHRAAERRDGRTRHLRYDWQRVAEHVPAYGRYVEAERARLGERHPLFRTQYLLEVVDAADRLFDAATLAQLEGRYDRLSAPRRGERYIAGLDLAGPRLDEGATGGGASGDSATGEDARERGRDWTVLTIARVSGEASTPLIEVVEHQAWRGAATEHVIARLADRLKRVWRVRHLAVDATGLGGPIADLLAGRLPRGVVEPVVFTAERKSRLGFGLLAAAGAGRLRLYRADGSGEASECRRQLSLARAGYRGDRSMQFDVDPADGHDDYLMSLALVVAAARHVRGERIARTRPPSSERAASAAGLRTAQGRPA